MASAEFENAVTIEAPSPLRRTTVASTGGASGPIASAVRGVAALVEGSTPHLTGETRDLLRQRLLAAASLFFGAFVAFWVKGFVYPTDEKSSTIFWVHTAVTAVMGLMVLALAKSRDTSLPRLRLAEIVVFGDPALFFLFINYQAIERAAT